jgi:hypothetical protein
MCRECAKEGVELLWLSGEIPQCSSTVQLAMRLVSACAKGECVGFHDYIETCGVPTRTGEVRPAVLVTDQ